MTPVKIVLIRPPSVTPRASFTAGAVIPPAGLAYVAAALRGAGHAVAVIDAVGEGLHEFRKISRVQSVVNGLSFEQITERIPADTRLIGLSCMFSSEWFYHDALIRFIRRRFPSVPIMIGGEHVTAEHRNILATCPDVDICVRGEGEYTALEVAAALRASGNLSESLAAVRGITFRGVSGIRENPGRERASRLDDLPWPAWDLIPVANYLRTGNTMTFANRRGMPVVGSRGCPFRCTFCTNENMWGQQLVFRDPQKVAEEIAHYVKEYDIRHVDFLDLVGVVNRRWTTTLLEEIIRRDLRITWIHGAGTRSEILDPQMLALFQRSGADKIFFAPETGSPTTARRIDKRVDLERMLKSMREANRIGLSTKAPLIFGFPGQTLREALESLVYAFRMTLAGVDDVVVHAFGAYPGSHDFHQLVQSQEIDLKSLIRQGAYGDFLRSAIISGFWGQKSYAKDIPSAALPLLQFGTMGLHYLLSFFLRPWRIVRTIRRALVDRAPVTFLEHVIYRLTVSQRFGKSFRKLPEEPPQ